ncbi:MAG: sensor histidine kinase, partial [Vicinamibacteria bacterium]
QGEALPADVRRQVFLAIKEAVNNVVKHAHATELGLTFGGDAAAIEIAVTDDGRGFAPDVVGGGHGLTGMRERMTAVGGSVTLTSTPGSGTAVRFRVPVAAGASGRMPMR